MTKHISRRDAAKMVVMGGAMSTVPLASAAAIEDSALIEMEKQINNITSRARAIQPEIDDANERCERLYPEPPRVVLNNTPGNSHSVTTQAALEDCERRALRQVEQETSIPEAADAIRAFYAEKRTVFEDHIKARIQAEHESGYIELEEKQSRLWDELDQAARRMFSTPAMSAEGIAAKARVLPMFIREVCPEDDDLAEQVSIIARDATRFS